MLNLAKVIKPWKEAGSLNANVNLFGFLDEHTFLTKTGDVGMVLSVPGVDYESLDSTEQQYAVRRLESALKAFGEGFHVYQYLHADLPFLFTILPGEKTNPHLGTEYLAVLETDNATPYYLNLHNGEVAHTLILGMTGSGKSFFLNFLQSNLQKYRPMTFIFDIGGGFESLTEIFGGSYMNVGQQSRDFTINPFSLQPTKENQQFLFLFFRVLIEGIDKRYRLDFEEERKLWDAIERMYTVPAEQRTLSTFANIIGELRERLYRWSADGQYSFLFDNPEDTLSFSRFQTFNFAA